MVMSLLDWHPVLGPIREGMANDEANDPDAESEGADSYTCATCGEPVDLAGKYDDGFLASDSLAVYCSARCATGD
jgi:hypothetical protein